MPDRPDIDPAMMTELDRPGARELLGSPDPARLAYNGPDGLPRVIPIGFLWTGDAVVVCTEPTSPKYRALMARPDVAVTIDTIGPPARSVLLRGRAEIEVVDGVAPEYLAAAAKGTGGDDLAAFEAAVRDLYDRMARITIVPTWARYFDYGADRLPTFLQKLIRDKQAG